MMFNVPQYIDIEDKIVGPLTAKQLGWLALGGITILLFWFTLATVPFIIMTVITALIFGALAFYRPYNMTLISFLMSALSFGVKSKTYVWKRISDNIKKVEHAPKKIAIVSREKKKLNQQKLSEISSILDKKL